MSGSIDNRIRNKLTIPRILGYGAVGFAAVDAATLYFSDRGRLAGARQSDILFPLDLNPNVPYIGMEFKEYNRRSIYQQPLYNSIMRIRLPIPENLVENTRVTYSKENLGSVVGSAAETVSGGGFNLQSILGVFAGAGAGLAAAAAREVPKEVAYGFSAVTGITLNPFQTVLFKAPEFRSHSFSWKFVPKSPDESEMLRVLIETFKYHSLPGISAASGVFFSYPEILEISFNPDDSFLYKFKPCVVESVQVNYAPNSPSFYNSTKAPTAISFDIQLQEIEIWTKADFDRQVRRVSTGDGSNLSAAFPGSADASAFGLTPQQ